MSIRHFFPRQAQHSPGPRASHRKAQGWATTPASNRKRKALHPHQRRTRKNGGTTQRSTPDPKREQKSPRPRTQRPQTLQPNLNRTCKRPSAQAHVMRSGTMPCSFICSRSFVAAGRSRQRIAASMRGLYLARGSGSSYFPVRIFLLESSSSGTPIRRLWGRLELLQSATRVRSPCPRAHVLSRSHFPTR